MDEKRIHSTKTSQSDFFWKWRLCERDSPSKAIPPPKKRNISHLTSSISRRVDHRNMMMARPSNFAINQPVFDIFICIFHNQHPSTISHLFSCIFFGHFYHCLTISGESCSERDKISIQNGKVFHIFSNHSPRDMSICLGICMRYIYLTSAQTTIWQTCLEHHTLPNMTDWNKPPANKKLEANLYNWKSAVLLLMAEIRRSPVEVGSWSHDLPRFYKHPTGGWPWDVFQTTNTMRLSSSKLPQFNLLSGIQPWSNPPNSWVCHSEAFILYQHVQYPQANRFGQTCVWMVFVETENFISAHGFKILHYSDWC